MMRRVKFVTLRERERQLSEREREMIWKDVQYSGGYRAGLERWRGREAGSERGSGG